MATIAEITRRIHANSAKHDKVVAAYRTEQRKLTAELDVLRAAEVAAAKVAGLSNTERQALILELGGN